MTTADTQYPVRIDAAEQPAASRALWLVKWLLLIPHLLVLLVLWPAFVLFTIVAFFAILVTGKYPRALFDFNLGVLRWSWRVHYYGYAALGTDRYPPFTLADVPDYPARLHIPYPAKLSRGLVLVKWWLLAVPHYLLVALFVGGGLWLGTGRRSGNPLWDVLWGAGGLVGLVVLIAALVLLFTGRYPASLYEFVLGLDRWVLRVAAYAGLMTDAYPPFRLEMGGPDPATARSAVPLADTQPPAPAGRAQPVVRRVGGWTAGRVVSVVLGGMMLFVATGAATAGGGLLWARQTLATDGFVSTSPMAVHTSGHAITSPQIRLRGTGADWFVDQVVGQVRLNASVDPSDRADVFVGIGPRTAVAQYLRGVAHTELTRIEAWWDGRPATRANSTDHAGGPPATPPTQAAVWAVSAVGTGSANVTWQPGPGDWTAVIMHSDGTPGIAAAVQVGATAPGLRWIGAALLGIGLALLAAGGLAIGVAVSRASRDRSPDVATV